MGQRKNPINLAADLNHGLDQLVHHSSLPGLAQAAFLVKPPLRRSALSECLSSYLSVIGILNDYSPNKKFLEKV